MAKHDWEDRLMVHNWPECGPGELSLEDLYQMFKKRFKLEQKRATEREEAREQRIHEDALQAALESR